jgi:hypothetical protein
MDNTDICLVKMKNKRPTIIATDLPFARPARRCEYLYSTCPLIFQNLKSKLFDHLLLGGEHNQKISPEFNSPMSIKNDIGPEEKKNIVLTDPKFGMFSLFKYHIRRGYLNQELKKSNKIYCSHIFSLAFALPILIFISQWMLYISLIVYEARTFDGNFCPNSSPVENKMMMAGIGIVYFVRSFFIWDNLTTRIGLQKMNRVDNISAILDTFQEFLFTLMVYGANIWIIFAEDDLQNMIMNSLAMEFLMQLDNEFEEIYFENLPGSAEDIYDNIYVTYDENKKLIDKRKKSSRCFRCFSCAIAIPYKILVLAIFIFPVFTLFTAILGPVCR